MRIYFQATSIKALIILFLIANFLTGCDKKENKNANIKGQLSWKVNGSSFVANSLAVADKKTIGTNGAIELEVSGLQDENSLKIKLAPVVGTGTFTAGGSTMNYNSILINSLGKEFRADNAVNSSSVRINITELTNQKVKGSFEGNATTLNGEVASTSGSFDIAF